MLSHGNLMAMSLCYPIDVDPVNEGDSVVYPAPMSHGAGLYNFIHVRCGARHVVPASRGFKAVELFELATSLGNVDAIRRADHGQAHGRAGAPARLCR